MLIGVFSDIHANLPALEAVLAEFAAQGVDEIWCAGDLLAVGPHPEETVRRIMAIPRLQCVLGNNDVYPLWPEYLPGGRTHITWDHYVWMKDQLSESSEDFLRSLPLEIYLRREGVDFYLTHYPTSATKVFDLFYPHPNLTVCQEMFKGVAADVFLYGHDHDGAFHQGDSKWYLNFSSAGCPTSTDGIANAGIVEVADGRVRAVRQLRVPYDKIPVIEEIRRKAFPSYNEVLSFFYGM